MIEAEAVPAHSTSNEARMRVTARTVMVWELRRLAAGRASVITALLITLFFAAIVLIKHEWSIGLDPLASAGVPIWASTSFGQAYEMVCVLLLFFGMLVPFLTTDAVARDYRTGVHELLMASAVSSGAYVWGRYLAALLSALVAAALMVLGMMVSDVVLHATVHGFPAPSPLAWAPAWVVLIVPTVVVFGSMAFALGALWPRHAMLWKVAVLLAWVGLTLLVGPGSFSDRVTYWVPTSTAALRFITPGRMFARPLVERYVEASRSGASATARALAVRLQQEQVHLSPWLAPRATLIAAGLICVALVAVTFRRFRDDLD